MIETPLPLAPDQWATVPAPAPVSLLEQLATLRLENAGLGAQNALLQQRIREMEARLGQDSSKSSRPPASDPDRGGEAKSVGRWGLAEAGEAALRGSLPPSLLPVAQRG